MANYKYSYEFKKKCVELYRQNLELPTPNNVGKRSFFNLVLRWSRLAETNGFEVLKPHTKYKYWDPMEKLRLVSQVITGKSMNKVAIENGLVTARLSNWVQTYKTEGYSGLVKHTRKKPVKEPCMNRKNMKNVDPLTLSERKELKFLREEIEYLKAENAILKKLEALSKAKKIALLKAKKQNQ